MARTDPTIYMRIPQELKDALDSASAGNRRSLTAEVVARLQSTFRNAEPKRTFDLIEDTAIASDEVLTPEVMALVREAATAAAERVVLRSQGFAAPKKPAK